MDKEERKEHLMKMLTAFIKDDKKTAQEHFSKVCTAHSQAEG